MALYSSATINSILAICTNFNNNTAVRGKAYEDLTCYIFEKIPGVELALRNTMNRFNTEEIDVAIWNNKKNNGLHFLPNIILIECKNWSNPVSSNEVSWFAEKLRSRGRDFGIIITHNGITGDPEQLTAAHSVLARHLLEGRQIIVITTNEITQLQNTNELIRLIKEKICLLTVSGTI